LGGLPFIIIPLLVFFIIKHASRIGLHLPFCPSHGDYWLRRRVVNFGSFALVILFGIGAFVLHLDSQGGGASRQQDGWTGSLCLLSLALPVLWLIGYLIHCQTGVRVADYSNESVTLDGVSEKFAAAVPVFRRTTVEIRDDLHFRDWNPRNRSW
jgi:hypothetical protein